MRIIKLAGNREALVDDSDFDKINKYKWSCYMIGRPGRKKPYAARHDNGKTVYMHRQILNPPKGLFCDHINANPLDNTRDNLRLCTRTDNIRNRVANYNSNGLKGTTKHGNKWRAQIKYYGVKVYLGVYATRQEAHDQYCYVGKQLFGDYFNSGR